MVRRGLADSRTRARQLIDAHQVRVNGAYAQKPSRLTDRGDSVEVEADRPRFVGRGGHKLEAALELFDLQVEGRRALDAGASTGGFTDCLLQAGASEVVAVDVGYGQLHERLRGDDRVLNLERTNIRSVLVDDVAGPFDLIVADLSFISLKTVLAPLVGLASAGADLVLLIKPQFEAGRQEASSGRGVISDPSIWARVLLEVIQAADAVGAPARALGLSPLRGGEGNVEFLGHFVVGGGLGGADDQIDIAELVASVPDR